MYLHGRHTKSHFKLLIYSRKFAYLKFAHLQDHSSETVRHGKQKYGVLCYCYQINSAPVEACSVPNKFQVTVYPSQRYQSVSQDFKMKYD